MLKNQLVKNLNHELPKCNDNDYLYPAISAAQSQLIV